MSEDIQSTSESVADTVKAKKPNKKRARRELVLTDIPAATSYYEVSYMHADQLSHVVTSIRHGYVLTASVDGIVKFWKRMGYQEKSDQREEETYESSSKDTMSPPPKCLEFVKSFTAHVGPVAAMAINRTGTDANSVGGDLAVSVGATDRTIKLYDVSTFDVTGMIRIAPNVQLDKDSRSFSCVQLVRDAVVMSSGNDVLIFSSTTLEALPLQNITLHAAPITSMTYNPTFNCMLTTDQKGGLELWDCSSSMMGGSNVGGISFKSKASTQLYDLMKKKVAVWSCDVSPNGLHYVLGCSDQKIRLLHHTSGQFVVSYDERIKMYDKTYQSKYGMDAMEYGKRAATEREMAMEQELKRDNFPASSSAVSFDATGELILVCTMVGIKVIDWSRNKVLRILGQKDASQIRFTSLCLCYGKAKVNQQMQLARRGGSSAAVKEGEEGLKKSDAIVVALAHNRRRLYCISHIEPEIGEQMEKRDIWNEAPDADDRLGLMPATGGGEDDVQTNQLGNEAILRTTMGDIYIKLFPELVPRTIENFCTHARNGYYDGVIFHRVIKGFMVQTGDPRGDGTGGESIWGGEFEDEFARELRHDRPFTVSMANAGKNTNGSQFFITTVPCSWLDNVHTVFGRVTKGMDVVSAIENVKTRKADDKPLDEINIQSIDIIV